MSWSTAEEIVNIITISRLCPNVSEAERKVADLRLIQLYASAVNIGDVLVEVAVASNGVPCGVRLAAALALESLLTERAWHLGDRFTNKECALSRLLMCLRNVPLTSLSATEGRLVDLLCSCLCRVIEFEYPTSRWEGFIDTCVADIVAGDIMIHQQQPGCFPVQHKIILRLAEVSASNSALWWNASSYVVPRLLQWAAFPGRGRETRAFCLRVALHLIRRRPRPSEVTEVERPMNSFIFSDEFHSVVRGSLVDGLAAVESGELCMLLLEECALLFGITQHLIDDAVFADFVFYSGIRLLSCCSASYLGAVEEISPLISCIDNALECLVAVLQTHPETSLSCDGEKLLSILFTYMTRAASLERDDESAWLDSLQEDCFVPLGCSGGDTSASAAAALELLMEANPQLLSLAVGSLCDTVMELQRGAASPHWRAWTTALRCLCRVCDEKAVSLTDSLPDAAKRLLSPLSSLLQQTIDPLATAELIDLLSLCLVRAEQEPVCRVFLSILETTFDGVGDNLTREHSLLLAVILHAVHRVLSTCSATSLVPSNLCDAAVWLRRAFAVMSRGDPLAVYSSIYVVQTLLKVNPNFPLSSASCIPAAVDNACRNCKFPNASSLLAGFVWSISAHTSGECNMGAEILHLVLLHCNCNGPHRAELRRCVADYTLRLAKASIQKKWCLHCVAARLQECLPVVLQFATEDAPHDEPTTRLLSSGFAAVASDGCAGTVCEKMASTLLELLRLAVCEGHSSATLSITAAAMSAVALSWPTLLDGDVPSRVSLLFSGISTVAAKGLNYAGPCLLLALSCVRRPDQLDDMVAAFTANPQEVLHAAWGAMLGMWSSIAPLADHFTTMYFLAAWCRLLRYAAAARAEGRDVLAVVMPCCAVYYMPSMHVKSLPKRRVVGCSVAQCIALGLALVAQRGRRAAKVKLLDEDILQSLSLNRRFEVLAGCNTHEAGIDTLFSVSLAEGAQWLLGMMTTDGFGPQVEFAMRFGSES